MLNMDLEKVENPRFARRTVESYENFKVNDDNQITDISVEKYKYIEVKIKYEDIPVGNKISKSVSSIELNITSLGIDGDNKVKSEVIDEINEFCNAFAIYAKKRYSLRYYMKIKCENNTLNPFIDVAKLNNLKLLSDLADLPLLFMCFVEFENLIVTGSIDHDCIYVINKYKDLSINSFCRIILKCDKADKLQKITFNDQSIGSNIHFASYNKLNDDESNVIVNAVLGDFKEFVNINFILLDKSRIDFGHINDISILSGLYNFNKSESMSKTIEEAAGEFTYMIFMINSPVNDLVKNIEEFGVKYPNKHLRLIIYPNDCINNLPKTIPKNVSIAIVYKDNIDIDHINDLDFNLTVFINPVDSGITHMIGNFGGNLVLCVAYKDNKLTQGGACWPFNPHGGTMFYHIPNYDKDINYDKIQKFISLLRPSEKQIKVVFDDEFTDVRRVYSVGNSVSNIDITKDINKFKSEILNTFISRFDVSKDIVSDVELNSEGIWAKIGDTYKLYANEGELNKAYELYIKNDEFKDHVNKLNTIHKDNNFSKVDVNTSKFVVYFDSDIDSKEMIIPGDVRFSNEERKDDGGLLIRSFSEFKNANDLYFDGIKRVNKTINCDDKEISYLTKMLNDNTKLSDYKLSDKSKKIIADLGITNDITLNDLCVEYVKIMKFRKYNDCNSNSDVNNGDFKFEIGDDVSGNRSWFDVINWELVFWLFAGVIGAFYIIHKNYFTENPVNSNELDLDDDKLDANEGNIVDLIEGDIDNTNEVNKLISYNETNEVNELMPYNKTNEVNELIPYNDNELGEINQLIVVDV